MFSEGGIVLLNFTKEKFLVFSLLTAWCRLSMSTPIPVHSGICDMKRNVFADIFTSSFASRSY